MADFQVLVAAKKVFNFNRMLNKNVSTVINYAQQITSTENVHYSLGLWPLQLLCSVYVLIAVRWSQNLVFVFL